MAKDALKAPPFLCAYDAAEIAQVNSRTIYRWAKRYNLGKKIGGTYRIDPTKLIEFLKIGNAEFSTSKEGESK